VKLAHQTGRALLWRSLELGGSRGIALVRTLVLARLLAPHDFGLIAIGMASVDVSMRLTQFGLREALIQADAPSERQYDAVWWFELLRALLVGAVVALAAPWIAGSVFHEAAAADIIRVLTIMPVVDHAMSIRMVELTRRLAFRPQAMVVLAGTLVHTVVAIALASSLGAWAMVIGVLSGSTVQTLASYVFAPWAPRWAFSVRAARPLARYGRGMFVTAIVFMLGDALLRVVISRTLGVAELGGYFLATRLTFLARDVVDKVIGQVAFPLHARLQLDADKARRVFQSSLFAMMGLVAPVSLIAVALAAGLVGEVLGPTWTGIVPLVRLLALAGLIGTLANATEPLLFGRGRPGLVALVDGTRSAFAVAIAWTFAASYGAAAAGAAWALAELAALVVAVRLAGRMIPHPFAGAAWPLMALVAAAVGGAFVATGVDTQALSRWMPWPACVAAVVGTAASAALLLAADRVFAVGLLESLGQVFPRVGSMFKAREAS